MAAYKTRKLNIMGMGDNIKYDLFSFKLGLCIY